MLWLLLCTAAYQVILQDRHVRLLSKDRVFAQYRSRHPYRCCRVRSVGSVVFVPALLLRSSLPPNPPTRYLLTRLAEDAQTWRLMHLFLTALEHAVYASLLQAIVASLLSRGRASWTRAVFPGGV